MSRLYCWRVGCSWEWEPGEKRCCECGGAPETHQDAGESCGTFVQCADAIPGQSHGHLCARPPQHEGPHAPHLDAQQDCIERKRADEVVRKTKSKEWLCE